MATKRSLSEAETLEQYRVALNNAENQPEIAAVMAELGYDSTIIAEGKALLTATRAAYDLNKTEDNETSTAYAAFSVKKAEIEATYALHRKKAKVALRNEPVLLKQLALTGSVPKAYVKWIETMKAFYGGSDLLGQLQANLTRLKVTTDDLQAGLDAIAELEALRATYLREVGESQDSTQAKDAAFAEIDDWMSEFYAVARIGLEDNPQLLESLGKVVK